MEHRHYIRLLQSLVSPETLAKPGMMGREMKVLKELFAAYPDLDFWSERFRGKPYLHSLLSLKTTHGAQELQRHWRLYQHDIEQKALDIVNRAERIEEEAATAIHRIESGGTDAEKPKPRVSRVDWADGAETD